MMYKPNLHSTTLLLYLVPTVNSFGLGVREFEITRLTLSGTVTSIALSSGLNSISLAYPSSAKIEIVWSIPPQAVPAILSAEIHILLRSPFGIVSFSPLACIVTTDAQTVNALLEDTPAAGGTCESIRTLNPLGDSTLL
jgi:hypothetical protein